MPIDVSPQQALLNKVRQNEFKDVTGNINVSPAGAIGKWLMGDAEAITNPWTHNVVYNPDKYSGMTPDQQESMMAHELVHVRQLQDTPWYKTVMNVLTPDSTEYHLRPREAEAFQYQSDRATKMGKPLTQDPYNSNIKDIELPKDRPINTSPRYAFGMRGNQ